MNRRAFVLAALAGGLLGPSFAHGQRQTERYIPIGRSPGVSDVTSRFGTVQAVDAGARAFELATPEGRTPVAVPAGTPIWIDRSRQRRTSLGGSFADLRPGRRVEVNFADAVRAGRAAWIKVEAE